MLLGQVTPDELEEVCGADPSYICRQMLELTESETAAETADLLFAKPFSIALDPPGGIDRPGAPPRVIDRFVSSLSGQGEPTRRIKRTLRRTPIVAQTLPDRVLETGAVSIRAAARAQTLGHVLHSIAAFGVWSIAVITILGELGVNLGPLIAGAGIAGIALGFGAQSLVKDFLAGIFIIVEDQYGVGDIIDVGELSNTPVSGTVESVSLRSTKLRSVNGTVWHVPNGAVAAGRQHEPAVGPGAARRVGRLRLRPRPGPGRDQAGRRRALARPGRGRARCSRSPRCGASRTWRPTASTIRLVVKTQPAEQFKRAAGAADAASRRPSTRPAWRSRPPSARSWVRRDPGPLGRRPATSTRSPTRTPEPLLLRREAARRRRRRRRRPRWQLGDDARARARRPPRLERGDALGGVGDDDCARRRPASTAWPRTWPGGPRVSTSAATAAGAGRLAGGGGAERRRPSGHGDRWMMPSRHHDHTSSVT